jgi:ArsR family transcriptional regulator, arsenate/arsenite/antimonite-responsive transcriptional repressor
MRVQRRLVTRRREGRETMNKQQTDYTAVFKALSNESRLKIFELIRAGHPAGEKRLNVCCPDDIPEKAVCVCEMSRKMNIGAPTISHHLKELRTAGLVDVHQRGQWSYYTVSKSLLRELQVYFKG